MNVPFARACLVASFVAAAFPTGCTDTAQPDIVERPCPPSPPSAVCSYGPAILGWATGWLARRVVSADDEAVLRALDADVVARCGKKSVLGR